MFENDLYLTFSFLAILIFGIPHGAFDASIAITIKNHGENNFNSPLRRVPHLILSSPFLYYLSFLIIYLSLAFLTVIAWISWPFICLMIFLLISGIHFGRGDSNGISDNLDYLNSVFVHGGLSVIVIPFAHPEDVSLLFNILSKDSSEFILPIINNLMYVWVACLAFHCYLRFKNKKRRIRVLEIAIMLCIISTVPPVASFVVYFCFLHSPRHTLKVWNLISGSQKKKNIIITTTLITIVTWIMSGYGIYFLNEIDGFFKATIQIIFIGLAALTVPHMILIDYLLSRSLPINQNVR